MMLIVEHLYESSNMTLRLVCKSTNPSQSKRIQIQITIVEKRDGFTTHNFASLRGMVSPLST